MSNVRTQLRSACSHKRWEAKQDVIHRLNHLNDDDLVALLIDRKDDPDHCDMRWADDGGRHVD